MLQRNFNEENGHVTVPATGLDGVPSDVIAGYTKRVAEDGSDVYDIPFRTVDMMPIVSRERALQDPRSDSVR
jgi:hypothetical protein